MEITKLNKIIKKENIPEPKKSDEKKDKKSKKDKKEKKSKKDKKEKKKSKKKEKKEHKLRLSSSSSELELLDDFKSKPH